jgi:hypothetical protein
LLVQNQMVWHVLHNKWNRMLQKPAKHPGSILCMYEYCVDLAKETHQIITVYCIPVKHGKWELVYGSKIALSQVLIWSTDKHTKCHHSLGIQILWCMKIDAQYIILQKSVAGELWSFISVTFGNRNNCFFIHATNLGYLAADPTESQGHTSSFLQSHMIRTISLNASSWW